MELQVIQAWYQQMVALYTGNDHLSDNEKSQVSKDAWKVIRNRLLSATDTNDKPICHPEDVDVLMDQARESLG
jgi:hypothetical protein